MSEAEDDGELIVVRRKTVKVKETIKVRKRPRPKVKVPVIKSIKTTVT